MGETGHINVLSDAVANKIAAGEVVDRPASVFKELVENALDAGATQVDIEVVSGGKKAVIVSDNGSGMNRDNALLSIERHATSKIRDVHDIENVHTLGFRGEALAAISSVSRFQLTTRSTDSVSGTEVTMTGGKLTDVKEVGCPKGTTIAVRNLFFNVPARRKFLRAEQTELSHIRQMFFTYALSCPQTAMRLIVDGKEVYRLNAGMKMVERLRELFDAGLVDLLKPVEHESFGIKVSGLAGLPGSSRRDRSGQYFFINGRPAMAPIIAHALREGYDTLLTKGRYPVVFLFLDMPPDLVDVNVHPTKKEVRFRKPSDVRDCVIAALRKALGQPSLTAVAHSGAFPAQTTGEVSIRPSLVQIEGLPQVQPFQYPKLALDVEPKPRPVERSPVSSDPNAEHVSQDGPWTWCRVIGQAGGLYVVLETEDGIVLMDPHAAHERVLYELYMGEVVSSKVNCQGLLAPENIELPPQDALCVRKNLAMLTRMGFGISEFGGDTFIVDAIPACLGNASATSV